MIVPRLKPGVRLHHDRVRDRWVLLAPERVIELDEPALAIIQCVDGAATIDAIATNLAAEFNADPAEIAADAAALLADLYEKGHVAL